MTETTSITDVNGDEAQPPEQTLMVTIVTGDRTVYEGVVDTLVLPGIWGQIAIRRRHTALLAELITGELIVRIGDERFSYVIGGGFVEVRDNDAVVLADSAESAQDIDLAEAQVALRRARLLVRSHRGKPTAAAAEQTLRLFQARVRVASRVPQRRRKH